MTMYVKYNEDGEILEISPIEIEGKTLQVEIDKVIDIMKGVEAVNDYRVINGELRSINSLYIEKGDTIINTSEGLASLQFSFLSNGKVIIKPSIDFKNRDGIDDIPDTVSVYVVDADDHGKVLDLLKINLISIITTGSEIVQSKYPYDVDFDLAMLNYVNAISYKTSTAAKGTLTPSVMHQKEKGDLHFKYYRASGTFDFDPDPNFSTDQNMTVAIVDEDDDLTLYDTFELTPSQIKKKRFKTKQGLDDIKIIVIPPIEGLVTLEIR